jgi:ABC-type Co2+ transport system permease subunit
MGALLTRWILTVYLLVVLAAVVVAALRLDQSTEMPGLAAIELVLLALPWSLALGVEPTSRFGLGGMIAIVLGGLVLNGLILSRLPAWLRPRTFGQDTN